MMSTALIIAFVMSVVLNMILLDRLILAHGDVNFEHTWMDIYRKRYEDQRRAARNYVEAIECGNDSSRAGTLAYLKRSVGWRDR